jgi:hypothetical protein
MSLYLGYGAPSAPLFIPTGGLTCTCDQGGGEQDPRPQTPTDHVESNLRGTLVAV